MNIKQITVFLQGTLYRHHLFSKENVLSSPASKLSDIKKSFEAVNHLVEKRLGSNFHCPLLGILKTLLVKQTTERTTELSA